MKMARQAQGSGSRPVSSSPCRGPRSRRRRRPAAPRSGPSTRNRRREERREGERGEHADRECHNRHDNPYVMNPVARFGRCVASSNPRGRSGAHAGRSRPESPSRPSLAIALLIPNHKPANPEARGAQGSAQLAAAGPKARLLPADRRAINVLLDRFMPAALTRRDPAAAWALAGPELRSGSTLAAWRAGTSPVPYYPVLEKSFHHWQTIEVGPRYVIFNILVHAVPRVASRLVRLLGRGRQARRPVAREPDLHDRDHEPGRPSNDTRGRPGRLQGAATDARRRPSSKPDARERRDRARGPDHRARPAHPARASGSVAFVRARRWRRNGPRERSERSCRRSPYRLRRITRNSHSKP